MTTQQQDNPQQQYPFTPEFQVKILALAIADRGFLLQQKSVIRPEFFGTAELRQCCSLLVEFAGAYQAAPSGVVFRELVDAHIERGKLRNREAAALRATADGVLAAPARDAGYVRDRVVHWAQSQAMAAAAMRIAQLYETSQRTGQIDLAGCESTMRAALSVGASAADDAIDYFKDLVPRMYSNPNATRIPTGYASLDMMLDGGLDRGELGAFIGAPGMGKTTLLTGVVRGALMYRYRTLVITNEVSPRKWAARIDRAITGKTRQEIAQDPHGAIRLIRRIRQVRGGLYIKGFPSGAATVGDIEQVYLELRDRFNFFAELLVVDYADELTSRLYRDDYRLATTNVFRELRALGQRRGIPVWTATQANREAVNREVVTVKHLAEAFGKAAVSDVMVAMCQTDAELASKPPLCRLFGAKNREGRKHYILPYIFIPERGTISPRDDEPVTILGAQKAAEPYAEVTSYGAEV